MMASDGTDNARMVATAIAMPLFGGVGVSTISQDLDWFENELIHPSWRPPTWLYTPVWTVLYLMMGMATYYVWRDGQGHMGRTIPLVIYLIKMNASWLWPSLFFTWHLMLAAVIDLIIIWVLLVVTIILFYRANPLSGYLLVPYFIWVTFVTALITHYYILNK